MAAEIKSAMDLLSSDLRIPEYQRPYRWTARNVSALLGDIDSAISEAAGQPGYRYRIGSVILHRTGAGDSCDIVDGQQRILSLLLLMLVLDPDASLPLLERSSFSDRETQHNLRANYELISDWVGYQPEEWRDAAKKALSGTLEAVVITVDRVEEAFQLFDSQNTRGRSLDPHDLLKAYHLRAMRDDPYAMRHVVTLWEEFASAEVRDLFANYLFPVANWELGERTRPFTAREIDAYRGVPERSGYTYAARARRAAPCFQVGEPFIEGEDFFLMAEHYLRMRDDIELELRDNPALADVREELGRKKPSAGFRHAANLFRCALFAYYDRFHNFDVRAVRKLFCWAMMVRVDMQSLGFDTINKYAIGNRTDSPYTNAIPMFSKIARARSHTEIADTIVRTRDDLEGMSPERAALANTLISIAKGGAR
ncbi:DUF262 domain-containing protein [Olsenella uli]|uniref:DUF262 domain-containing protein n=1 Tax=Olsenella uli TaxID=133926 RepID=UPI0024A92E31|nr:DUF262 domain-containing protein [Olsenella uli]